jgi:hypothetical protein
MPGLYGTRRFIVVFTSIMRLITNLNVNKNTHPEVLFLRFVLILSFNLCFVFRNSLFSSGFATKTKFVFSSLLGDLHYSWVDVITIATTHFSIISHRCNISLLIRSNPLRCNNYMWFLKIYFEWQSSELRNTEQTPLRHRISHALLQRTNQEFPAVPYS